MQWSKVILQSLVLVFVTFLVGCFSSNPQDIAAFVRPEQVDVNADNYIMQPPDEIEVYCTKAPEIHAQRQRIRPDGKVSFEALGELHAAGRTPKQLADALKEKIIEFYTLAGDSPIDVRVVAFRSKVFYVLGQVYHEGTKTYTGRDTVLTALAEARPSVLAWITRVQVIRPSANEDIPPKIFEVDYEQMKVHGDTSKNVLLQEGDIVYVPPTILAAIAMKVEEFVTPIGRAFSTVNIVQRVQYAPDRYGY
jgi:polysaccharide export outer membrane protein